MNLLAIVTNKVSWAIRQMQSGYIQRYSIWFLGGALGLAIILLLV